MKIYLTLLCLICGGALAGASTNTAAVVQDKPVRLYVASDTLFHDTYFGDVGWDNDGGLVEGHILHHDDYHWQDGVGGNGSAHDEQESDDWDGNVLLWSFTNGIWSVMTWTTNGSGIEIDTYYAGSIFTNAIGLPLLTSEHCLVNDPHSPPIVFEDFGGGNWATYQSHEEYVRYADTRWRLQTGGRAGRSGLFQLSASAARILDKRAERPFYNVNSQAVPPQNITVMGRALYADANLWMVLPDCTDLDVTPFVAGSDFYTMSVTPQKYTPAITANGVALNPAEVVTDAHFCVGQNVPFSLSGLPGGVAATNFQWTLDGTYVNDHTNAVPGGSPPGSSENYFENESLLTSPVLTNCWWVSGGFNPPRTYEPSVTCTLLFSNGNPPQPYNAQGLLTMHRPKVLMLNSALYGTPANVWQTIPALWVLGGAGTIGLGFATESLETNSMSYVIGIVSSNFDGHVKITQICSINGTGSGMNHCTNWLDNADPYNQATYTGVSKNLVPTNPQGGLNCMRFEDAPSASATLGSSIRMDDSFVDYIMFIPDFSGSDSIYVPLGTISWSTTAGASWPNATITPNWPIGPTGPDTSLAWPAWTNVFANPN
jgi:hypothetical protein